MHPPVASRIVRRGIFSHYGGARFVRHGRCLVSIVEHGDIEYALSRTASVKSTAGRGVAGKSIIERG